MFGEPQGPERRRDGERQLLAIANDELHAAAADVDDQRRLLVESDESAFLLGGDDARRDAGEFARGSQELAAVLRLAYRGRRGAENPIHLVAAGELDITGERVDRRPAVAS